MHDRESGFDHHPFESMRASQYLDTITQPLCRLSTPVWLFDVDRLCVRWANEAALDLWNALSLQELCARDMSSDISSAVRERLYQYIEDLTGTKRCVAEHWTFYPKGVPQSVECSISVLDSMNGQRWLMVHALRADAQSEPDTLYRSSALLHSSVMVSVFDRQGQRLYSNPSSRSVYGSERRDLGARFCDPAVWRRVRLNLAQHCSDTLEAQVETVAGTAWHRLTLELCPDPVTGKYNILVSETDITEQHRAQALVERLAYTDTLTQLPNRTSWLTLLRERLTHVQEHSSALAVLFIDLDRFKLINDTLGHSFGDRLLVAVSRRLRHAVPASASIARLGGDEFTVLIDGPSSTADGLDAATRILAALDEPLRVDGHTLTVKPSIGVSRYPEDGQDEHALMKHADLAMYAAKEDGGGVRVFHLDMMRPIHQRLALENELREALESGTLEVHYQPKVEASTGVVVGMEALARWPHAKRGWIPPPEFIGIAEETGIIAELTSYVMCKAFTQQRRWLDAGHDVSISVNVSARELRDSALVDRVRHALAIAGCPAHHVELEITESMLMDSSDSVRSRLVALHNLGVRIGIDDFGTGYSNLGYLHRFPLDTIKIDRSFLSDQECRPVVEMILAMGRTLSLAVVAEGVETDEQRQWLIDRGCEILQGFLFSRPVDARAASDYLAEHSIRQAALSMPVA